jgi:hypothetical protein
MAEGYRNQASLLKKRHKKKLKKTKILKVDKKKNARRHA